MATDPNREVFHGCHPRESGDPNGSHIGGLAFMGKYEVYAMDLGFSLTRALSRKVRGWITGR